ncbi:TPA: formate C-acetyltransferase [Bacillus thuringiensis]|uniref:Formate acetyltransferase n=4 Tax=Bacillus cereus group TaxID=86661 RepID=A0A9X9EYS0_BACCE|nr:MULTISPECIES: formate C-acetyltransferase [Bacillus]CGG48652.1 pyruvate formate-lyase [Streptococcus pneumoniae]AGE76158.1 formate acetyltransferase [Bacillus thuringiensis serovar kurstaki str. HD73]AHX16788.1 formate acetyltransferase [Bacillus bombysepticus str. Wang]AHZ49336.1 pyruvate formate-lyase [Bacillus thuringiensis serovar kurstaki str. YBT-1520]AIE31714.1 pyruvate formate-lyase [Bacillus thuringiensis serovar kurstaki str. HD-1]
MTQVLENVKNAWENFKGEKWKAEIDVRDFILNNVNVFEGDESFLAEATEATKQLWDQVMDLTTKERENGGVLDMDTKIVSSITSHAPGYLNKDIEKVVGFQTDKPFKRSLQPYGGIRMAEQACESYGYEMDKELSRIFRDWRKTHNQGVFDAYTPEMRNARKSGVITGLPDAYGRGRIIGDYRRVALYGIDHLIEAKKADLNLTGGVMSEDTMRLREELSEQMRALQELKEMAASHGFDISKPATNTQEAFQWLYFAYLAAIKEQNGAAMSLGRTSTFLDIYIERDLANGTLTEEEVQEIVDHFIMKLRLVKFARTPDYNELFSGDPTWVTESIGGMALDGRPLVTKNSFRFLHTLDNLGPAPEPNLTVLWSKQLPENFKNYCAKMSIKTSAIQYENDDIMRPEYGDDYGIACCVSAMRIGKQMQFFGARANLAKALLYAINGGKDEKSKAQVGPEYAPITSEVLNYEEVMHKFDMTMEWLAGLYLNTLNVIHYMHDKYSYERIEMALHDTNVLRTMATGIAGLSVVADSLSAIKYAKVKPIRDENGIAVDFEIEGDFPKYGNNDDRVDEIAVNLVKTFMNKLRKHKTYRNSVHTMSILTITSNVVYGKKTGNTPDGRRTGEPFAPGANPMHGRDTKGALASLLSVAKLPYEDAQDGISNTFSIIPKALGKEDDVQVRNLVSMLDGYAVKEGHHLNINVFNRETLMDAMEHPEKYPQLTIRVSGYAVNFIKLTREQQIDVINRTMHESM